MVRLYGMHHLLVLNRVAIQWLRFRLSTFCRATVKSGLHTWYKNIKKQMVRLYGMHHLLVLNASSV